MFGVMLARHQSRTTLVRVPIGSEEAWARNTVQFHFFQLSINRLLHISKLNVRKKKVFLGFTYAILAANVLRRVLNGVEYRMNVAYLGL